MAGDVFDADFDIANIEIPQPVSFSYEQTPEYKKEQREKRWRQIKKEQRERSAEFLKSGGKPTQWFDPASYNPNTYVSRRKQ
jgi:hypothetical protein